MRQVATGIALTFAGPQKWSSCAITLGFGTVITVFYLVMLPSLAVGSFSLITLRYLTPSLALAAAALGYGFAATIAINVSSLAQRSRTADITGVGALLGALLPGSLCCTSIVPSLLAAFGASVSTVLGTTGKIQSAFARFEGAFIAASIAGVALSVVLAARSRAASCCPQAQCEVPPYDPP
jgi:hypothetical protein